MKNVSDKSALNAFEKQNFIYFNKWQVLHSCHNWKANSCRIVCQRRTRRMSRSGMTWVETESKSKHKFMRFHLLTKCHNAHKNKKKIPRKEPNHEMSTCVKRWKNNRVRRSDDGNVCLRPTKKPTTILSVWSTVQGFKHCILSFSKYTSLLIPSTQKGQSNLHLRHLISHNKSGY